MKIKSLFLFILSFVCLSAFCEKSKCKTRTMYDELGNRKSTTIYSYDKKGNMYMCTEADENKNIQYFRFKYDKKGNVIESSLNNKFCNRTEIDYDKKGNKLRDTTFSENGNVVSFQSYEYNKKGNLIHSVVSLPSGKIMEEVYYEYDDKGKQTKTTKTSITLDNEEIKYEYLFKGNITEFYVNGELKETLTDEYNEKGDLKKTTSRNEDGISYFILYKYEYDENE